MAQITKAIAYAAGRDAGNRSMKAAGRTVWSEDDWNAAAQVTVQLMTIADAGTDAPPKARHAALDRDYTA